MKAVKIQKFVEKNMTLIIAISIISGTLFGLYLPTLTPALKPWIPVTLFLMLYPMMVGIQVEQLAKAAKSVKEISVSMLLNFIISPLIGFLVATLILGGTPSFQVALILLAATPCAGMVVGWTGMAKGNAPLALIIVSLSLVLSIVTIPLTMRLLAGSLVTVDFIGLFKGTFLVILIPLVLGDITRRIIIRKSGQQGFMKIKPILPPLSMLGMFLILFISLALGANKIVQQWQSIFIIFAAILVFYFVQLVVSVFLVRRAGMSNADGIALVYSVVGKNVSLAVGLASQFFSPLTVAMLAINPLVQAPLMAWFMRWSGKHMPVEDIAQKIKTVNSDDSPTNKSGGNNAEKN